MEIDTLVSEAESALREADPLCTDANAFYAESKVLIEQSVVLWARIMFLHSAQQDELQSMGNLYIIVQSILDRASSDSSTHSKALERSRTGLNSLLDKLRAVRVDRMFGQSSDRATSLYSYVHEDDIGKLEASVSSLLSRISLMLSDIESAPAALQEELKMLRARAPDLPEIIPSAVPRKLARLSSRISPYAQDMAELLESLTRHYDLVSELPSLNEIEAEQALDVIRKDRPLVAGASDKLKECRTALRAKHRESQRLQHSLAESFEQFIAFQDDLEQFTSLTVANCLNTMASKRTDFEELFLQVNDVVTELEGLTEYYRLFHKSYQALVVEVGRRQEAQKQLQKVVENANTALKSAHARESDTRQTFVDTYAEFLPKELWPGMSDMPSHYEVHFEPEDLPEVSKESLARALAGQHVE